MAVTCFENMLGFSNHLYMFSEEIARTGEQLGNTPQAFSHLSMIRYVSPSPSSSPYDVRRMWGLDRGR